MNKGKKLTAMSGTGISSQHNLVSDFARQADISYQNAKHVINGESVKRCPQDKV